MNYDLVIISYNAKEYLQKLISSLTIPNSSYEGSKLVIDNASIDGTQEWLANNRGNFTIILNKTNLGYGAACNQGAKLCNSEIIGFLNMDIEFIENIEPMIEYLSSHEDVAVIGPKQVNENNEIVAAPSIGFTGAYEHWKEKDKGQADYIKESDYISGSAFFTKRKIWEKLGGFLETPLYCEDSFFCWYAKTKGYKSVYYGLVKMIHYWRKSPITPKERAEKRRIAGEMVKQECQKRRILCPIN